MRIEQEEWKAFFRSKRSVLFLLFLAIVSSTLYVVYLQRTGELPNGYLTSYLTKEAIPFEIRDFIIVFFRYFKRYLLIWLFGCFNFLVPVSLVLAYIYIFSYGFSMTWLYIMLGMNGMWTGVITFGLQGLIMITFILYLIEAILNKSHVFGEEKGVKYSGYLVVSSLVCCLVTFWEMLI